MERFRKITALRALESQSDVHVYCRRLDPSDEVVARLNRLLSADECQQAESRRFAADRRRYIVAHGWLRSVLADHLGVAGASIEFSVGPHGKPELIANPTPLHFNMSHSDDLAVLAVAIDRELGVDIERIRPVEDLDLLVSRFFSPGEQRRFRGIPAAHRPSAFFQGWTRKEAYLKATGAGLSFPTHLFEMSLEPTEPPRLIRVEGNESETERWTFRDLPMPPDYCGALAVERPGWRLRCFEFNVP